MNSAVGPIFMKKLLKSEVCGSCNSTRNPQTNEKWLKSQKYTVTVHEQ